MQRPRRNCHPPARVELLERRELLTADLSDTFGRLLVEPVNIDIDLPFGGIWLEGRFEVYGSAPRGAAMEHPAIQNVPLNTGIPDPVTYFTVFNETPGRYMGTIQDSTILEDGRQIYVGDSQGWFFCDTCAQPGFLNNDTYWFQQDQPVDPTPQSTSDYQLQEVAPDGMYLHFERYGDFRTSAFTAWSGGIHEVVIDMSSDGQYAIGGNVYRRAGNFFDTVDLSGFDFSVSVQSPTWHNIEVGDDGQVYLAGSWFDLETLTERVGFWDIDGRFIGTAPGDSSYMSGFGVIDGEMFAAVRSGDLITGDDSVLIRLSDMQSIRLGSISPELTGDFATVVGPSIRKTPLFATDGKLGVLLTNEDGPYVAVIETFIERQVVDDTLFFQDASGQWFFGQPVNGQLQIASGPRWSSIVEPWLGDVNNDGYIDLIGFDRSSGNWWVATNQQDGTFRTTRWGRWFGNSNPFPDAFTTEWNDITLGDFDGDGLIDVAGRNDLGRWWIGYSTGTSFRSVSSVRWNPTGWQEVMSGDFNADGRTDLVARNELGQWWIASATGTGFQSRYVGRWTATGWAHIEAGDFNADGLTDIIGLTSTGHWWVAQSNGVNFTNSYRGRWSGIDVAELLIADFTGDGIDDILARSTAGTWYLAKPHPDTGRFAASEWTGATDPAHRMSVIGDFQRDGFSDVLLFNTELSTWIFLSSTGTDWNKQILSGQPPIPLRLVGTGQFL
ncbi:MAG: VCBS repeat-containing protein [Planctomycetaceae bacterium]|nr:VCBS repeat-containing protein [Planctomycetaceae bacterium]MCB9952772.1 VCBS repeat-containing protein [Planctomycetaceae bacterium]